MRSQQERQVIHGEYQPSNEQNFLQSRKQAVCPESSNRSIPKHRGPANGRNKQLHQSKPGHTRGRPATLGSKSNIRLQIISPVSSVSQLIIPKGEEAIKPD